MRLETEKEIKGWSSMITLANVTVIGVLTVVGVLMAGWIGTDISHVLHSLTAHMTVLCPH